jgi:hypothetical protein
MVNAYPGPAQPGFSGTFFPGFKSDWLPMVLVGIAAALIFTNGAALLSSSFFAVWGSYLPWLASLGSIGFILGIMLGLVLLGALILVVLHYRVMAAFVIFPTALVSLLIGGGFVLGAVLAVIAGIILLL